MFDVECSMFLSKSARGLAHSKTLRVQCELSKQPTGLGLHRLKQGEHSAARCASIWPSERPARRGLRALPTNFPRNPNPRCKTRIIFPRQRRAKSLEFASNHALRPRPFRLSRRNAARSEEHTSELQAL